MVTADERRLLRLFRGLDENGKEEILQTSANLVFVRNLPDLPDFADDDKKEEYIEEKWSDLVSEMRPHHELDNWLGDDFGEVLEWAFPDREADVLLGSSGFDDWIITVILGTAQRVADDHCHPYRAVSRTSVQGFLDEWRSRILNALVAHSRS